MPPRDQQVNIRLTQDELDQLKAKAGREPLARYMRRQILSPAENPPKPTSTRSRVSGDLRPQVSTKVVQADRIKRIKELVNTGMSEYAAERAIK